MSGQASALANPALDNEAGAARLLRRAAVFWFVAAVAGQWTFVTYIAMFYGPTLLSGDFQKWTRNKMLIDGYLAGDPIGNVVFAAHVAMAAVLTFGGTVQLIPQIRERAIWLHRLNGRLFMIAAIAAAIAGLGLQWIRGTAFHGEDVSLLDAFGTTLDGVLILTFAVLAWRAVLAKNIEVHQRWATRLFLVVNGVWFLRVGFMAWMVLTAGKVHGVHFFDIWSFGAYLLPLAVYEFYWRAKTASPLAQRTMAGVLIALTLIMAVGEVAAFLFMWRPLITASMP